MNFSLRRAFLAMLLAAAALGYARYFAGDEGITFGVLLAICLSLIVLFTRVSQIPRLVGLTLLGTSLIALCCLTNLWSHLERVRDGGPNFYEIKNVVTGAIAGYVLFQWITILDTRKRKPPN